ncbi:SIMPL domain-containing protein [Nostoc flagelliforme FACHB-838]|uniref:SIMPL domain-containing protein n=1 Tax=Nostoc flagelliforme FACHB-838 TaxID=2692904 RepID=A0ABR8E4G0_9NOSO|nr:SIMPL domain-containing protein [Nostoc flagelliforme]MBD2535484.1 SIMPL domain-containing protein [Nostoc flagelliforme FACHB-838]
MNESTFYIEVISEGKYTEKIEKYVLSLVLEVRAAKEDTALNEVMRLRERCINHLLKFGLKQNEIFDGGTNLTRPWYKKKVGQEASVQIILQTENIDILSQALNSIEEVKSSQREVIQMNMRQPIFSADEAAVQQALQLAIRQAKAKATVLATEANVELAGIFYIEELSTVKRNSGVYGDEDWFGDSMRFGTAYGAAPGGEVDPEITIESPQRILWIRYKVRFRIVNTKVI